MMMTMEDNTLDRVVHNGGSGEDRGPREENHYLLPRTSTSTTSSASPMYTNTHTHTHIPSSPLYSCMSTLPLEEEEEDLLEFSYQTGSRKQEQKKTVIAVRSSL